MNITFTGTPSKRWGYEQAFASGIILQIERQGPDIEAIEQHLNAQFGMSSDNKTTFEMVNHETRYYITFHDFTVHVGTSVRPYRGDTLPAPKLR